MTEMNIRTIHLEYGGVCARELYSLIKIWILPIFLL